MVFCQGGLVKRALVVVAVTGLCLMGTAPAWAVFPGANGRITYSAYGGIIHTILPSGHGDTVIAPQTSTDPAWSPTGRRLTFTGDPEGFGGQPDIYTMRADGSDVRRLTFESEDTASGGAWHPSYSPGGGRIAFSLWHYRSEQIATIRNDGSHRRVIASWGEAGRAPIGVVWSPSGEVAYALGIGGSRLGVRASSRCGPMAPTSTIWSTLVAAAASARSTRRTAVSSCSVASGATARSTRGLRTRTEATSESRRARPPSTGCARSIRTPPTGRGSWRATSTKTPAPRASSAYRFAPVGGRGWSDTSVALPTGRPYLTCLPHESRGLNTGN